MSAELWVGRAERGLRSAELLLADGDANAACNEAYYAMFYATRAALLGTGEDAAAMSKTHTGLVAAFNKHFILAGRIEAEHGRNLGREANRRLIAAYEGEMLEADAAREAIGHATEFVAAVEAWLASQNSSAG